MLTIISPDTGKKIQIAEKNLDIQMDWNKAMEAAKKLGDGWRLPTIDELEKMYFELEKKGVGNFEWGCYWSSSDRNESEAWYFDFAWEEKEVDGKPSAGLFGKYAASCVRAVRNL
jgi:hypothetical protein